MQQMIPLDGSQKFLYDFMKSLGVEQKTVWNNNNNTLEQEAYVVDVINPVTIQKIYATLSDYNKKSGENPLVAVPVSGWEQIQSPVAKHCSWLNKFTRKQRFVSETAQSFSLSEWTTAKNADVIIRTSSLMQQMYLFQEGDKQFFRVTGNVRITDADEWLLERGFVLPLNLPTLHVASLMGTAANGCYGPTRDGGPMTTNIVEMKGYDPNGKPITLSKKDNPDLFHVLRDFHAGAMCVTELTLENIEPKFRLKRHNILFKDVQELKIGMGAHNYINDEHFAVMYIPVDIDDKGHHYPRIRVTTMERTTDAPSEKTKRREQRELSDYVNLITTDASEPLINHIVEVEELRPFFPLFLKAGAIKTYGLEKETEEIDWAPYLYHIFRTYTRSGLVDFNWLITVESVEQARDLLVELLELVENGLIEFAEEDKYPLFNAFARFLDGLSDPEGKKGATCTVKDDPKQKVLSFELLSYLPLSRTPEFQTLLELVINHLQQKGFKFTYHPGKTWPDNVTKLSQVFNDAIGKKRLQNTRKAVDLLHGGHENIRFSATLTPQKKRWLYEDEDIESVQEHKMHEEKLMAVKKYTDEEKKKALQKIGELAQELKLTSHYKAKIEQCMK
jgi:hypothetical protein